MKFEDGTCCTRSDNYFKRNLLITDNYLESNSLKILRYISYFSKIKNAAIKPPKLFTSFFDIFSSISSILVVLATLGFTKLRNHEAFKVMITSAIVICLFLILYFSI